MDSEAFGALLNRLGDAWNAGDGSAALECFTEDIVYVEPPGRQRYAGHAELFELSSAPGMSITWHHLAFDPLGQVGFAEYTFRGRNQYHGVAVIHCLDGRIARWREYQRQSDLTFEAFST